MDVQPGCARREGGWEVRGSVRASAQSAAVQGGTAGFTGEPGALGIPSLYRELSREEKGA